MREPFFNNVIADIALDLGQYKLDLEFERTDERTVLSSLSPPDIPRTRGGVSRRGGVSPKLSLDDKTTVVVRRAPKPGVRGQSSRWTRMERSRP